MVASPDGNGVTKGNVTHIPKATSRVLNVRGIRRPSKDGRWRPTKGNDIYWLHDSESRYTVEAKVHHSVPWEEWMDDRRVSCPTHDATRGIHIQTARHGQGVGEVALGTAGENPWLTV